MLRIFCGPFFWGCCRFFAAPFFDDVADFLRPLFGMLRILLRPLFWDVADFGEASCIQLLTSGSMPLAPQQKFDAVGNLIYMSYIACIYIFLLSQSESQVPRWTVALKTTTRCLSHYRRLWSKKKWLNRCVVQKNHGLVRVWAV